MLPINISRLRQQSSLLFFSGELQQGYQLIRQCIELQPQQSQHHVNKALFQYAMGNAKTALDDLHKAITLDHLNYQAYFNIFSIQMQAEEYQAAFKNLCCCISVLHLLKAEKEEDLGEVEKAIQFSFNNKEARLFKSILKMQEKKNIEALNQINYAVYLDPSHSSLKIVQEKVYKMMGMKQLTSKAAPLQKPKYDRLETNKEIPAGNKIKVEIEKLLREFNRLLKEVDIDQLYKVTLPRNEVIVPKEALAEVAKTIKPKLYIAQKRAIEQQCEQSNLISDTSYKYKEDKNSTTNNSEHVDLSAQKSHSHINNKPEHFFLFQTSFSNLSVSDIGQNSKISSHRNFYGHVTNETT